MLKLPTSVFELEGLRIFYESLREQVPESAMAEKWLLEHGLLPEKEAKAVYKRLLVSKRNVAFKELFQAASNAKFSSNFVCLGRLL